MNSENNKQLTTNLSLPNSKSGRRDFFYQEKGPTSGQNPFIQIELILY